jgi:hypothetical protein
MLGAKGACVRDAMIRRLVSCQMKGGCSGMHDRYSTFHPLISVVPVVDVKNVFVVQNQLSKRIILLRKIMLRTSRISM